MKNKMNYSRWVYLENFINSIMNLSRKSFKKKMNEICNEIEFQINSIEKKAEDGYWGVTDGDKVFISFMQQLRVAVLNMNKKEINQVLTTAQLKCEKSLKIVFLCQETVAWPSFESLYNTVKSDSRFEAKLVYVPFKHPNGNENINYYDIYVNEYKLPILMYDKYSFTKDSPDIAIFIKPYDLIPSQYYIKDVAKIVTRCVYIPYAFFDIPTTISIQYGYGLLLHHIAWLRVAYSEKNLEYIKKYGYTNGSNAVVLGHPRFDTSAGKNGYKKDELYEEYANKIRNRRTLLWNTHHGVLDDKESIGAFLQYKDIILDYFKKHKELVLLWRPHPLLLNALKNNCLLNENEIEYYFKKLNNEDNIIVDFSKDYINSFALSHALISDGGSSITFEYIATGKPVYYTVKSGGYVMPKDSIAECYYWINSPSEIEDILDRFAKGEDTMKQERIEKAKHHVGPVNGKCGQSIKEYIFNKTIEEEKERAKYVFS